MEDDIIRLLAERWLRRDQEEVTRSTISRLLEQEDFRELEKRLTSSESLSHCKQLCFILLHLPIGYSVCWVKSKPKAVLAR